jgi:hypothetical protein
MTQPRHRWVTCALLTLIVGVGVLSRVTHSGVVLIDKYLGDALYAVMLYLLICLFLPQISVFKAAALAFTLVLAIESFQLTGIPDQMHTSANRLISALSVALGTTFSIYDIIAYVFGIGACAGMDRALWTQAGRVA